MNKEEFIRRFEENRLTFLHGNWEGVHWLLNKILVDGDRKVNLLNADDNDGQTHFLGIWIRRSELLRKTLDEYWNCPFIQLTEIFVQPHQKIEEGSKCDYSIFAVRYEEDTVRKQAEYIWENDIVDYCEKNGIRLDKIRDYIPEKLMEKNDEIGNHIRRQ